ncbi:outer membrane lipoprotein chaperone LolA [Gammaproteobacteria bacterium AS21]|jgi:outer membrane lipoprotein carrier protein
MISNNVFKSVLAISAIVLSTNLFASSAIQQLESLMAGFTSYSAQFEQYTKDDKGKKGEISQGLMQVQRPNKFRWETKTPFPQLIVSDGENIWIYDEDLAQATRKKVQPGESNGAALILNGDLKALNKRFEISQIFDKKDEKLFELIPKEEGSFEKIQLFFAGGVIRELLLVDILGKQTTIILTSSKLNQNFKASLFDFKPPKNTDVMIDQQ